MQRIYLVILLSSILQLTLGLPEGNLYAVDNNISSSVINQKDKQLSTDPTASSISKVDATQEEETLANTIEEEREVIKVESSNVYDAIKEGGVVMIPLVFLFLASLTLIIERCLTYTQKKQWNIHAFIQILNKKSQCINGMMYKEALEEELHSDAQAYVHSMGKGLDLLSGIGNIAPLMGFLGTVLGMIDAFSAIATSTNVNAKIVAEGIKEALVTTAGGLVVAVPTLVAYYIFMYIINNSAVQLEDVIKQLCSGQKTILDVASSK